MRSRPRQTYKVTDVIATRELEFVPNDGPSRQVTIRFGRPRRDRQHVNGDWVCPFEVVGISGTHTQRAFGVDGLQALSLAFHIIPIELSRLAKSAGGGQFCFHGDEDLHLADGCGILLNEVVQKSLARDASSGTKRSRRK